MHFYTDGGKLMVFNSFAFIIFFAIVAAVMALTNIQKVKNHLGTKLPAVRHRLLLIASYVFYSWWDWRFSFLLLGLTATTYFCALRYDKTKKPIYTAVAVIVPLVVLGFFKYFGFFVSSFAALFGIAQANTLTIILPLGISFYIFQALSYTIDIHRGKLSVERSFHRLALYISFFPQVVSGPVVKAREFLPQLKEDRNISLKNVEQGIQLFVFGLFKKIVISDHLAICVSAVYSAPENFHAISVIFAVLAYAIQIYFDFSGYSDMAIGCAKVLGYDLPRNFNMPYISRNVTEFWKRWHISLSTWLMEYLYIPLGGNRKGTVRTYINLFLTMLIGGLWHGAAWTFVIWGALHGGALCVHKLWMKLRGYDKHHKGTPFGNIISGILTFVFVSFGWIFFRAENFTVAFNIIKAIFTWQNGIFYISSWTLLALLLTVVFTSAALLRSARKKTAPEGYYPIVNLNTIWGLTLLFVVIGLALGLAYTGGSPFIYVQF